MRHHQKYFSVEDAGDKLAPQFVAVMNIPSDPEGFVRRGNERVLRARFNDARFFWDTDQKKKLADRVEDLAHVTFQAKLGSYLEKTRRMMKLAAELGGDATPYARPSFPNATSPPNWSRNSPNCRAWWAASTRAPRASRKPVWQAIYDHYKPESMEDAIPRQPHRPDWWRWRISSIPCAAASAWA